MEKGRLKKPHLERWQIRFIVHLVRTGALKFEPTVLSSKRKSFYYVNLAKAMSDGKGEELVAETYFKAIEEMLGLDSFDYIHGPAYKGIPLAALVAYKILIETGINKRWGYNRKEEKTHGDKSDKVIVGDLRDGDRVLILEDVITSGGTLVFNCEILKREKPINQEILALVSVDREELTGENITAIEEVGLTVFWFLRISEILSFLYQQEIDGRILVDDEVLESFSRCKEEIGSVV